MTTTPWTDALAALTIVVRNAGVPTVGRTAIISPKAHEGACAVLAALTPERARLADCAEEMLVLLQESARVIQAAYEASQILKARSSEDWLNRFRTVLTEIEGKGEA